MKQFFSFNDDNGILFHDTAEEAKVAALADLDAYRDDAKHDGEWPGEVEGVRWGRVLGMTRWKKTSSDPESFEYELEDVQPNNKKEQPQAEPVLPSDIETDCEPAPLEVAEHQSPQPLSDERLEDIALDVMGYAVLDKAQNEVAMELMRKVEAAHGITKGPQQ